ncbi:hypothetical protein QRD43_03730 [Pelomonas sp. APW6]|uniref:Proline-rich protein n=1 Tax=Roseateles subflavus TaxID=3053353 RepID=A0ABT7LDT5_9BURK|nr:hypothetical protein [Pelomonas sp. APW6]MDL5031007.1 hypothetical protein [Pelomonas sp. APW6]
MLDQSYQKTDAGRAEMKVRQLVNARATRNLLLVIDASKSARQWLGLVQGSTEADVQQLLQLGMIQAVGHAPAAHPAGTEAASPFAPAFGGAPAAPAPAPASAPAASAAAPGGDVPQLDYEQLYAYLTRHAKQYLGLMKGYKVVLEVERCSGLPELQDYARRFVEMVREAQGDDLAEQVRRAMGMH